MTHENFAYWLNGFVELNKGKLPTEYQWRIIQDHLALTFNKVTPNRNVSVVENAGTPRLNDVPPFITC